MAAVGPIAEEEARSRPLKEYVKMNLFVPVAEEVIFRLIASSFLLEEKLRPIRWDVGLSAAAVFAAIHNVGQLEEKKYCLNITSLPLEQFALGTYIWYAIRTGGFGHAAVGHIIYNHACSIYPQGLALRLLGIGESSPQETNTHNKA